MSMYAITSRQCLVFCKGRQRNGTLPGHDEFWNPKIDVYKVKRISTAEDEMLFGGTEFVVQGD